MNGAPANIAEVGRVRSTRVLREHLNKKFFSPYLKFQIKLHLFIPLNIMSPSIKSP